MSSSIIRVAKANPSTYEELGLVEYETAPDIRTALEDAKRHRDVTNLVTVVQRVFANWEEQKEAVAYRSVCDSEFEEVKLPEVTHTSLFDDTVLILPNLTDARVHWVPVQSRNGGRTVRPALCPTTDELVDPKPPCLFCNFQHEGRRVVPQHRACVLPLRGGVLQEKPLFAALTPPLCSELVKYNIDAEAKVVHIRRDGLGHRQMMVREDFSVHFGQIDDPPTHVPLKPLLAKWALLLSTSDPNLHQSYNLDADLRHSQSQQQSMENA